MIQPQPLLPGLIPGLHSSPPWFLPLPLSAGLTRGGHSATGLHKATLKHFLTSPLKAPADVGHFVNLLFAVDEGSGSVKLEVNVWMRDECFVPDKRYPQRLQFYSPR